MIEIRTIDQRGRAIFARQAIAAGAVIEAAPVVIVPASQCAVLDRTILHDYYFHWDGDPDGEGRGALGLGLVSLCNHSSRPRARVSRNFSQHTLDLIAIAEIEPGAEITINYGCDLWFEPRD
ncbi:MAG: SET domain-containing protein [Stellaceae bacterium]